MVKPKATITPAKKGGLKPHKKAGLGRKTEANLQSAIIWPYNFRSDFCQHDNKSETVHSLHFHADAPDVYIILNADRKAGELFNPVVAHPVVPVVMAVDREPQL